jgi:Ni2+-binding GTPase involved in maturation of urease and hydrogenase
MKKWEYTLAGFYDRKLEAIDGKLADSLKAGIFIINKTDIIEFLNVAGEQGWEAFSAWGEDIKFILLKHEI